MPRLPALHLLRAVIAGGSLVLGGASAAAAYPGTPDSGWRWPLPGRPAVVRPFQAPAGPYAPGHRGVDLSARPGGAVLAAGAGVVRYAGLVAGRGVVTVAHAGGLVTEYEPVRATVRAGQRVGAGSRLGVLHGRHGGCAEPCLHWGLRRGAVYLDPLTLLGGGPLRLLPLDTVVRQPRAEAAGAPWPDSLARWRVSSAGSAGPRALASRRAAWLGTPSDRPPALVPAAAEPGRGPPGRPPAGAPSRRTGLTAAGVALTAVGLAGLAWRARPP